MNQEGKWGYIDETGNIIVPYIYHYADKFNNGLAKVHQNGQYGFVNLEGKEILACEYDGIEYLGDEFFKVSEGRYNQKHGIVNASGRAITPCHFDGITYLGEGYFKVLNITDTPEYFNAPTTKYGIVDAIGNEIVPCKYHDIAIFDKCFFKVKIIFYSQEKYGLINKQGQETIPIIYKSISSFKDGLALVELAYYRLVYSGRKKEDKPCQINENGLVLFEYGEENIFLPYHFVFEPEDGFAIVFHNWHYGIIDIEGKEILPCKYCDIEYFGDNFFRVANPISNWLLHGMVNTTGQEIIPCRYETIGIFNNDFFRVSLNGFVGLINKQGQEIAPTVYNSINSFIDGLAQVKLNDEYCEINEKGLVLFDYGEKKRFLPYHFIFEYENGLAKTFHNGKYGFIDLKGKEILPCIYEHIYYLGNNFFKISEKGKWGIINVTGREIVPCKHERIEYFSDDFFKVSPSYEKTGIVNALGHELIPCKYHNIEIFDKNFFKVSLQRYKDKYLHGLINQQGQVVAEVIYDSISCFKDGLAQVEFNTGFPKKICQINEKGLVLFDYGEKKLFLPYHFLFEPENGFVKTFYNGKYGFIDLKGKEVLPCIYEHIYYLGDNFFIIYEKGKWGIIYVTGHEIVPCKYESIKYLGDDFFKVSASYEKNGIVNALGHEIVPCKYESIEYLGISFFKVSLRAEHYSKLYGIVDALGHELIPCKYHNIEIFDENFFLFSLEKWDERKQTYYGLIDIQGQEIVPALFDSISCFKDGLAQVKRKYLNVEYTCKINESGLVLFDYGEKERFLPYHFIFELNDGLAKTLCNGKYGLIDKKGKEILPCEYDDISYLGDGFYKVLKQTVEDETKYCNREYGLIDIEGKEIMPCEYETISYLGNSFFSCKRKSANYGIVDNNGTKITEPIYSYIDKYNDSLFKVFYNNRYGIINRYGKIVLPIEYEWIDIFSDDFIRIELNGKFGYINSALRVVIPCKYDGITDFQNGIARARMGRKWGLVDHSGRVRLLCSKYNLIRAMADNIFVVGIYDELKKMKYGAIDKMGNELIPCKYNYLMNFHNNVAAFNLGGELKKKEKKVVGGKWGLVISNGTEILKADKYDYLRGTNDDRYIVGIENSFSEGFLKCGAIDNKGKEIIPCIYGWIRDFYNGIAGFSTNGKWNNCGWGGDVYYNGYFCNDAKWGFVDKQNNIIYQPRYDFIAPFKNGYSRIRLGEKYGFFDLSKKIIQTPVYDRMSSFSEELLCVVGLYVENKLLFGYINTDNNIIIPCQFDKACDFKEGKAYVNLNGNFNYIDIHGNLLHEWEKIPELEPYYQDDGDDERQRDEDTWYALTGGQYGDYPKGGYDHDLLMESIGR